MTFQETPSEVGETGTILGLPAKPAGSGVYCAGRVLNPQSRQQLQRIEVEGDTGRGTAEETLGRLETMRLGTRGEAPVLSTSA